MVLPLWTTHLQKGHPLHMRCLLLGDHRVLCCTSDWEFAVTPILRDIQAYDETQVPYMTGHSIDKDIQWTDHTCNMSTCIRGYTPSIWSLHPNMITYIISHLLLFGLIWRECIDTFQSDNDIVPQCHYWRGRAHNRNAIGLPICLESPWTPWCKMLCHCQRAFQPVPHTCRTGFPSGW